MNPLGGNDAFVIESFIEGSNRVENGQCPLEYHHDRKERIRARPHASMFLLPGSNVTGLFR